MSREEGTMHRRIVVIAVLIVLVCVAAPGAQTPREEGAEWRDFIAWFRTAPPSGNPLGGYGAALQAGGTPQDEIQRRIQLLGRLLGERSDWIGLYFDKVFSRPLTGHPAEDGFNAAPSALLVEATAGLRPGTALDAGMGQGRNAIYLAGRGWTTTGFDLSDEAVTAARANAGLAGVRMEAVKASYADFDFGTERWDLIVLAFAWAPVDDPAFVARLRASLRPDGRVVFEHFIDAAAHPRPPVVKALQPGQLRALFTDFRVERYEEVDGVGDWGGPGQRLVRMVAVRSSR
jgi:SAM-dependent methyltransferase